SFLRTAPAAARRIQYPSRTQPSILGPGRCQLGRLRYCSFRETPCRRACRRFVWWRAMGIAAAGYELDRGGGIHHVGNRHLLERLAHGGIDAVPVAANIAGGLDAAETGCGGTFGQPERLVIECVYNVGDTDVFRRLAQGITAPRSPGAFDDLALRQGVQYLADHRLPEAQG